MDGFACWFSKAQYKFEATAPSTAWLSTARLRHDCGFGWAPTIDIESEAFGSKI